MKKLTPQDVDDLLADYYEGHIGVSQLSKDYRVTKGTVYYHIKIQAGKHKILHPVKYLDHVRNHILALEQQIKNEPLTTEQISCLRSEIKRLHYWLKVDRYNLPAEPFVLQ